VIRGLHGMVERNARACAILEVRRPMLVDENDGSRRDEA
jgi:hypothetical protein